MKKIILVLSILFSSTLVYSQSGWFQVNNAITDFELLNIQFTSLNTGYAVGCYKYYQKGEILKTVNAGLNWQRITFDTVSLSDIYFNNDNTGYLIGDRGSGGKAYIFKTTNGGTNWDLQLTANSNGFFKVKFYDYNTGFVAGKYFQVLKTTNGGINWISKPGANLGEPTAIWFFDTNNLVITDNTGKFNTTSNGGDNWITYNFYNTGISFISIYFFNSTTAVEVSFYGEIYKTTNSGVNWFMIDSLPCNLYGITFINSNTGYICGGAYFGCVYKTTNGGYNWTNQLFPVYTGLSAITFLNDLTGYATGLGSSMIFKTTNGGAVFIKNISGLILTQYTLYQNYPNPFNPSTKIKFDIPGSENGIPMNRDAKNANGKMENGNITLKVYDILGKEIETLVNEKLNTGTYEVKWNASNYPSGVYFYRLIAGDYQDTKRMVMIK